MEADIIKLIEQKIMDINPFAYAFIDEDLNILHSNEKFDVIYGRYDIENITSVLNYVNINDTKAKLQKAFEEFIPTVVHNTNLERKGIIKNQVLNFYPILDNGKKYMLCILNDFTDVGNWQKEFNIIFEKVPVIVSLIDKNFNIIRANDRFKDTFGDIGSIQLESYRKKHTESNNTPTAWAFQDGEEHKGSILATTLSGDKGHFMVTSIPIAFKSSGSVSLVLEISNDITEINQLQEQLHQTHDFYAEIIENSADAVVAISKKGKTLIFNESARKLFSWNQPRKPGIPKIQEMLPKECFADANENGKIATNKEIQFTTINGDLIPVRLNAFELKNKKQVVGRVAFLQDLREIKALEQEKKMNEQEAVSKIFFALDSNVSKILDNQNQALINLEKSLDDKYKQTHEWFVFKQKFFVTDLIVSNFMNVAKGYKLNMTNVNISELLNETINQFKNNSGFHDIVYNIDINQNCDQIYNIDKNAIQIISQIFISNSIDAIVNETGMKKLDYNAFIDDDRLIIKTKDYGKALKADFIEKLFTSNNSTETRLGLMTIKMIVDMLQGELSVSVEKEYGNTFTVEIPLV